jgi:hypothetical protein
MCSASASSDRAAHCEPEAWSSAKHGRELRASLTVQYAHPELPRGRSLRWGGAGHMLTLLPPPPHEGQAQLEGEATCRGPSSSMLTSLLTVTPLTWAAAGQSWLL